MADIVLIGSITPDRRLVFDGELPPDAPVGEVKIVISPLAGEESRPLTLGELVQSDVIGMWADREDMADSAAYVEQMRREAAERRFSW